MLCRRALFAAALLWAAPSYAAVVSERADSVTVTIYHPDEIDSAEIAKLGSGYGAGAGDGLAFVTETRTIDLPAGPAEIEFRNVTSTIVSQTADIEGLPAETLERNFDYDLLSPGSLLAKSIGQSVTVVRTDPRTGKQSQQQAIIRSAPNGLMLEIDGKFEALHCSGLPEKLVFENTPEGLRDTPTLSVRTNAPSAGHYTIKLSYIATGLDWSADYNARILPDGRTLDLSGWITLANFSATNFRQAPIQVVAGRVNATGDDIPVTAQMPARADACWQMDINWAKAIRRVFSVDAIMARPPPPPPPPPPAPGGSVESVVVTGSRSIDPRALGDYKIYQLPELTDVAARQTKQVQFLDQQSVPFARLYVFSVPFFEKESLDVPATLELRLQNTKEAGLGKPLPAGTVSAIEPAPDGSPILLGQQNVKDTPTGLPLEIETGAAMDVRVLQRVTADQKTGEGDNEKTLTTFEIVIENGKSVAIPFELRCLPMFGGSVVAEDEPHIVKPKGFTWSFELQPGERKIMHFTYEQPE